MKNKKNYWSNPLNIALFSIMMALLGAILVCFIILFVDSIVQANNGSGKYVMNSNLAYAFAIISIITAFYGLFYAVTLIVYFLRKKKKENETNVKIKTNDLEDKEVIKMRKTFDAEVIEENAPNNGVPTYIHVVEEHNIDKKTYNSFIRYLMLNTTLMMAGLCLAGLALTFVLIVLNRMMFIILVSILGALLIAVLVFYLIVTPNIMYKKMIANKMPTSIRIYKDRVEEVAPLATGKEIIYVFDYKYSKCKEINNCFCMRSKNGKIIVGLIIEEDKIEKEKIDFIKNKMNR